MLLKEQGKSLLEAVSRYSNSLDEATVRYLAGRGISEETARSFSLGTVLEPHPGHEQFTGWLSIPYVSALGIYQCVKFRRLDDAKPKYGQPIGQKLHIYNVADTLSDTSHIAICEGELDAVVLSGEIGIPAVGIPGVAAWKPFYSKLFLGFETVFVIGDNDEKEDGTNPGAEFSRRVAGEVLNSQIVQLPSGMDLNEYYLANGQQAVRDLLGVING
jgi:DNA primase